MNIQPISFKAQNKTLSTTPTKNPKEAKLTPKKMINEAQVALGTVPTIKNASIFALKKANDVVYDSTQVQQKANKIMSEIIDTGAYQQYCKDSRNKSTLNSAYVSEIKLDSEIYNVKITKDKISAFPKEQSKDIYEFDTTSKELTYFAQGLEKQNYVTSIDKEFFFEGDYLKKCNLDVIKSNFNLISESFEFDFDGFNEHILKSFSSKIVDTKEKTRIKRLFNFNSYGTLLMYSRNYIQENETIEKEIEYEFSPDGNLKTLRKDFVSSPNYWGSKLFAQFENENDFYVESYSKSNKTPEYSSIYFYQDGTIEGSEIE